MFNWFKKDVEEEFTEVIEKKNVNDNVDYSKEVTSNEINYLLKVLRSDEVKLEPESSGDFYSIICDEFYFSGFAKDKKSAFVAINWNTLKLNDDQKEIIHNECLIAVKCICERRAIKVHSKARKKLNELMNG